MTLPGQPKIKINPTDEERANLPEWLVVLELEIGRSGIDVIEIQHVMLNHVVGALRIARRDACTLADHIGAYLWKAGDVVDDDTEPESAPEPNAAASSPNPGVQATSTVYQPDGSVQFSIGGYL